MKNRTRALGVLATTLLLADHAVAQEQWTPSRAAAAADVSSIDGIVRAFYEVVSGPAGQRRDWARDSTLYLPGVRFVTVNRGRDGRFQANVVTHAQFARGFEPSANQGFFEKEIHRVMRRFGPMVNVFSTYEWRRTEQGPVGGRGINSLELFHDGQRWWIAAAMWADEDAQNPIPAEYLPGNRGAR
jgi:hypothetical protein